MTQVKAVIAESLRAAGNEGGDTQVPPVAVFWCDPEKLWEPVIGALQQAVPILKLGEYDPEAATGPAIWIRSVLAQPEKVKLPEHISKRIETNPWVIYLPGVAKAEFSEAEQMAEELQPLAELELRSSWWVQPTNRTTWTPHGFLKSKSGANINLANDDETKAALNDVLGDLLTENVEDLRYKGRLDQTRLHKLTLEDDVKTLLHWIGEPDVTKASMTDAKWKAFLATTRSTYGLDPAKATPISAAEKLGARQGNWSQVWQRFAENPATYPGVPEALRAATPAGFGEYPDSWPAWSEGLESDLRRQLAELPNLNNPAAARQIITELASANHKRGESVWAQLGQAPLAAAIGILDSVAGATANYTSGRSVAEIAEWYVNGGYEADRYALEALASVENSTDSKAVLNALAAIYDPWVDDVARVFQTAAIMDYPGEIGLHAEPGTCVVFVDALRFDLATRLKERLTEYEVSLGHRVTTFPTKTSSGQPAVAPVSKDISLSWKVGAEFEIVDSNGRPVQQDVLNASLEASGVQPLDWGKGETGDPTGIGWTKDNSIDNFGHNSKSHELVFILNQQINRVADRVRGLLDEGWRRIVVVTDHGFLLPAVSARKVELPVNATAGGDTRRPRVARLRQGLTVDVNVPVVPWTWDESVLMASAPGSCAFRAGVLYEHGGLSPQECITPVLTVTDTNVAAGQATARIAGTRWTRQRCRIDIEPADAPVEVELRLSAGDAASGIADPKRNLGSGEVKLLVDEDKADIGTTAFIVLLHDGKVVAQEETTVGGA